MFRKRSIIVILAGLNLLLLGLLVAGTYSLPAAMAQSGGRSGDFVNVTAKAKGQNYDVVYLLDVPAQKLHAFYPANLQQRQYGYGQSVDLAAEFAK
jgi:hypothetical protein